MKTCNLWTFGLGPLFETPPGPPAGNPPAGDPPAPPAPPAGGAGAPPAPPAAGDHTVPYARFAEQQAELQRLKAAEQTRLDDEAKKKGDYESLAAAEKARTKAAEDRAARSARRLAFVAKATGKVNDADAAFKLAEADGMLSKIEIDDDDKPKDDKVVESIVTDLVKKYEFLKAGSKNFGEPAGGNGSGDPTEAPKAGRGQGTDMLRRGYADSDRQRGR